jgi:hypothetical protein
MTTAGFGGDAGGKTMSVKKHAIAVAVASFAIAAAVLWISSASAATINFDDIPVTAGSSVDIDNYAGFTWSNVSVENNIQVDGAPGYENGIVSQTNAMFNNFADPATFTANSGTFTLNHAYFTGAFLSENVVVTDNLGDSKTFAVTSTTPTLENFDWNGASSVTFAASLTGLTAHIVVDDITVSATAVPEVSTWVMMLSGFAAFGFAAYQRQVRAGGALA